ncbi:hypothetical protein PCL_01775 [Purpureocillium lilacinum]|uniref:Uncharacterized protein n=1 Tax=Purpureocillium lilacinum TaxID=33203 RepID=A0A2U3E2I1_PURLI|nr:hypothetical protein PCL_01775 [Purpureocillium lilacinum]
MKTKRDNDVKRNEMTISQNTMDTWSGLGGEGTTNASKKEGGRREDEAAKEVGWGDAERVREADGRLENSESGTRAAPKAHANGSTMGNTRSKTCIVFYTWVLLVSCLQWDPR